MKWLGGWLTLLALGASVAFCGTSAGSFCDAKCDCERDRCSDRDFEDCEFDYEDDAAHAERRGCEDFFEDYADCVASGDGCDGDDADGFCGREENRWKDCVR